MKELIREILPGIVEFRHALHRIPEMAGEEKETSRLIRERLASLGIEAQKPFLETDVVTILQGEKGAGKNVTLRADIDALPLEEKTGVPYCSTRPGFMHACGHDGHTAMLMGAAEVLNRLRDTFAGSVRCVWQPGEESKAMARELLAAGALEEPKADLVTALHGCPGLPMGCLALRTGAMDASCAHFRIVVHGRGGHSSRPHQAIDPIIAASALVMEVQTVVSRRVSPQQAGVMSICRIDGGKTSNVIPDEVVLEGTARALDPGVAEDLEKGLREITEHVCRMHRCTFEIEYNAIYPVNINAPGPADLARGVIRSMEGDRLRELQEAAMGAEDFAYFLQRYPGVYVKVGTGEDSPALHNSRYNFPDELLPVGIEYLVRFALEGLKNPEKTSVSH